MIIQTLFVIGLVLYCLSALYGYMHNKTFPKTAIVGIILVALAIILATFWGK